MWPELLEKKAIMIGTFKTDMPSHTITEAHEDESKPVIGLRMPYDIPLQRYSAAEVPWVATMAYAEEDWLGETWGM